MWTALKCQVSSGRSVSSQCGVSVGVKCEVSGVKGEGIVSGVKKGEGTVFINETDTL